LAACGVSDADDIVLLAHSLNAIRQMLKLCDEFATEFDKKSLLCSDHQLAQQTLSYETVSL